MMTLGAIRYRPIIRGDTGTADIRAERNGNQQVEWEVDPTKKRISPLLKTLIPATLIILVLLATLVACSEPTPAPDPTATLAAMAAATQTPTETPAPTANPTAATAAKPTSSTTPEPTTTPVPDGRLAPIQLQDSESLQSSLSDAELACIGDDPEQLTRVLTGAGPSSRDEHARLFGCLNDETLARLFLAGFVPAPEPLSLETSDCVREAFDVIDPREVMTAGLEGDPARAMGGSMTGFLVTTACLTDKEFEKAGPETGMSQQDRAGGQCLMSELGGPGKMAEAMLAAQEGDLTSMANAAAECGLDMGPMPVTPPPTPQATSIAATPAPLPATPMPASTASATTTTTNTLVITVAETPAGIPEYDRSDWKHWVDEDGDCQDARQEVLVEESLEAVTYETDRECRVETGRWWAPHLGHFLENPSHIDVDHHVPLKNAHLSGGWRWDAATKEEYANDLTNPDHLVAISSRHNRSKGARGPEEWAPPDNALWCQYAVDWAVIKEKWDLTMTPVESGIVMDMLGTCENPPEFEVEIRETMEVRVGVHKPTAEPEGALYGSCEEAAAAGEQRVQGNQGGGRGFPKRVVPSARDGDGDGIVCER